MKKTCQKLLFPVLTLAAGTLWADVAALSVVTNGTTLTVGVPAGQEYLFPHRFLDTAIEKIVKEGLGTLNLGVVTNTFGGLRPEFEINAGILKGIHGYNNANGIGGSFGRAKSFKIADGAQLYFLDTMSGTAASGVTTGYNSTDGMGGTWIGNASVEASGAGPDGTGAIRRPHAKALGGHDLFGVDTTITLKGPTTFGVDSRWGIGGGATLDMNGYNLTLLGSYNFEFARGTKLTVKNPGRFIVDGAQALFENAGSSCLSYAGDVPPTVVATNNGAVYIYQTTLNWPVETAANAASSVLRMGNVASRVNELAAPLRIGGQKVVTDFGSGNVFTTKITGGITGNTFSYSGSTITTKTTMFVDGPATNNIDAYEQTRGALSFRNGSTNVIRGALVQKGGLLTFTNGVSTAIGSITLRDCANGTALTLCDAGFVVVTNATAPSSSQTYVPNTSQMSIRVGYNASSESTNITRMVVAGRTVLGTRNTRPSATQLADGFVGVAAEGTYDRAIFEVRGGAVVSNDFYIGSGSSAQCGAIYLSGTGSKIVSRGTNRSLNWIGRGSSYGAFEMTGGSLVHGGYVTIGQAGRGFFVQRGGDIAYGDAPVKLGRTTLGYGHLLQLGGAFGAGPSGLAQIYLGYCDAFKDANGYTAVLTTDGRLGTAPTFACDAVRAFFVTNSATATGTAIVNLNAGATLATSRMYRDAWGTDITTAWSLSDRVSRFYVNFDGGTLKTTACGKFFNNSATGEETGRCQPTRVTVYAGGATVDTGTNAVSMIAPFLRPYGKGVAGVTLTDSESLKPGNSLGTRRIRIGGAGYAADAVTDFHLETRSNAVEAIVTCPGFGYDETTTAKVEAYKNYGVLSNATVRLVDFESGYAHGGFTKKGTGTLTLQSTNTWGGATRVEAGTLAFTHADGYPGGDLEFPADSVTNCAAPRVTAVALPFRTGAVIRVTDADKLDKNCCRRFQTVATVTTPLAALPSVVFVDGAGSPIAVPGSWSFRLAKGGTAIKFGYSRGVVLIFR